jgi:RND family efflux transporter MFP subunit
MSSSVKLGGKPYQIIKYTLISLAFVVIIVILMMLLMGTFHKKVRSSLMEPSPGRPLEGRPIAQAELIRVPVEETAVGSVRPVRETGVAPKILAKVIEVNITAGQTVKQGDVLARLDDSDLRSRRDQAAAALQAARVRRDQAKVEYDRIKKLEQQNVASQLEIERVTSALKEAEAQVQRAEESVKEAETILGYATITAPMSGTVIDKRVDVGDTVSPGQVLMKMYDHTRMQLVASVRETLAQRLEVGRTVPVQIEALAHRCDGNISEIVPEAEAATRSFSVKVTGPCPPGVYPGMFGRLIIPLDEEEVVVVPRSAIRQVGQLATVDIVEDERLHRRAVRLGRTFGDRIEILSGLQPGEKVAIVSETSSTQPEN